MPPNENRDNRTRHRMKERQHSAGVGVALVSSALGVLFILLMPLLDNNTFGVLLVILGILVALVVVLMLRRKGGS